MLKQMLSVMFADVKMFSMTLILHKKGVKEINKKNYEKWVDWNITFFSHYHNTDLRVCIG